MKVENIEAYINDVYDFPKKGIVFKDITPLLANFKALSETISLLSSPFNNTGITHVAGVEARGFIFASLVSEKLGAGFIPLRKAGKLPGETLQTSYALEYGEETLELKKGLLSKKNTVLIVDDVLATGGTAEASAALVASSGATIAGFSFLIELNALHGRQRLGPKHKIKTLLNF